MLQYILVKILEPRQDTAGKVGIVGIKFYGFVRKPVLVEDTVIVSHTEIQFQLYILIHLCLNILLTLKVPEKGASDNVVCLSCLLHIFANIIDMYRSTCKNISDDVCLNHLLHIFANIIDMYRSTCKKCI